jgi:hypothetical protein
MNTLPGSMSLKTHKSKRKKNKIIYTENPLVYLSEKILEQAFLDIECYYQNKGTPKQQHNGHIAILWLTKKDGAYPLIIQSIISINQELDEQLIDEWVDRRIRKIKESGII